MKIKFIFFFGFLFSLNNLNAQWISQTSGTTNPLLSTFFVTNNVGYCAEANGAIIKTINGGANWTEVSGPKTNGISQIIFTSVDTGHAVCGNGILKTMDGGISWQNNFTDSNLVITFYATFPSKMVGYITAMNMAMDSIFLYKTTNGGDSWSVVFSEADFNPCNVYFTNNSIGFMNIGVTLYKTINGGLNWNSLSTSVPFYTIHFPTDSIGYVAGSLGEIYKTTDEGNTWSPQVNSNTNDIFSIFFTSIDTGYAVGGNGFSGMILKTTDGGINWNVNLSISQTLQSVYFPSSSTGYSCGDGGIIYKYSVAAGVNDFETINEISIFPNPNNGKFELSMNNFIFGKKYIVSVLDVIGNIIQQSQLSLDSKFDISNQAKGIYFLKVESENGATMKKIIFH